MATNRALAVLRDWAASKADSDPDESARPLWAQIAAEVDGYLEGDAPPSQPGPALFATGGLLQPPCQCKERTQ